MPSEAENYKLLFAIISQITTNGRLIGIDWKQVADELGAPNAKAANLRWSRFKQAHGLSNSAGGGEAAGASAQKATKGGKKGVKKALKGKGKRKRDEIESEAGEGEGSGGEEISGEEQEDGLGDQGREMGENEQAIDNVQDGYGEEGQEHESQAWLMLDYS